MNELNPKELTRRRAIVWTAKAGTAVAAATWVVPQLTSTALAQTEEPGAGSPCPDADNPDCPDSSTTTTRPDQFGVATIDIPSEMSPGETFPVVGDGWLPNSLVGGYVKGLS